MFTSLHLDWNDFVLGLETHTWARISRTISIKRSKTGENIEMAITCSHFFSQNILFDLAKIFLI